MKLLVSAIVCGLALAGQSLCQAQNLQVPPMPYAYNALEPYIDEQTMRIHHLGHHKAYTDKLNAALTTLRSKVETKYLAKMGIDKLLQHLEEIPETLRGAVRNNGGGYVNHEIFWQVMGPKAGGEPTGDLAEALSSSFGSFGDFKKKFGETAAKHFGSGWAWLAYDQKTQQLYLTSTPNQDTPAMVEGQVPILALDVWEHAYYLKHQNRRTDYIEAFWNVVNWQEVARRFHAARGLPVNKDDL